MSGADDSSDVLSKAEEFLTRRRAQLGGVEPDEIPVLTEVVTIADPVGTVLAESAPPRDFSAEISRELDAWLDENLPLVVVHVMDGVTDKLIQQVHDSARAELLPRLQRALRDDSKAED